MTTSARPRPQPHPVDPRSPRPKPRPRFEFDTDSGTPCGILALATLGLLGATAGAVSAVIA